MKNYIRVISGLMIFSILYSVLLIKDKIVNIVLPNFDGGGVSGYLYVLIAVLAAASLLKLFTAYLGITALLRNTEEPVKQKKLTVSGKLAVAVIACGLLTILIKVIYSDSFLVIDIFDIALNILLGLMFVICSMYVRSGRD